MNFNFATLRKRFTTRLLTATLVAILIITTGRVMATPLHTSKINYRQIICEQLLQKKEKLIQDEPSFSTGDIRAIIHDHLDPAMLRNVQTITGNNFRFVVPGQNNVSKIAVLTLHYADAKSALRMNRKLSARNKYFRGTIILTYFSSTTFDNQLIIMFTETSGDVAVTGFISKFPEILDKLQ